MMLVWYHVGMVCITCGELVHVESNVSKVVVHLGQTLLEGGMLGHSDQVESRDPLSQGEINPKAEYFMHLL